MTRDVLTEENLAKVRALNDIAKRRGQTLAEMRWRGRCGTPGSRLR